MIRLLHWVFRDVLPHRLWVRWLNWRESHEQARKARRPSAYIGPWPKSQDRPPSATMEGHESTHGEYTVTVYFDPSSRYFPWCWTIKGPAGRGHGSERTKQGAIHAAKAHALAASEATPEEFTV